MKKLLWIVILSVIFRGFSAGDTAELKSLTIEFKKTNDRSNYLHQLVALRDQYVHSRKYNDAFAIDATMLKHPLPPNADESALSSLRIGKWRSPRHDYLYQKDGRCYMLPIFKGSTRGRWQIEGNQYYEWSSNSQETAYTIILLDSEYFICFSGETVFYERRLK